MQQVFIRQPLCARHWARLGDPKMNDMVSAHRQERKTDIPWGGCKVCAQLYSSLKEIIPNHLHQGMKWRSHEGYNGTINYYKILRPYEYTNSLLIIKEKTKPQISYEICPCLWYKLKSKIEQKDNFDSSSLHLVTHNFKKITYFNAINGNMNSVESNSPWSPICTISAIIIDTDQHILTGSEKKWWILENLLLVKQLTISLKYISKHLISDWIITINDNPTVPL